LHTGAPSNIRLTLTSNPRPKPQRPDPAPQVQAIPLLLPHLLDLHNAHLPPNHLVNSHLTRVNNVLISSSSHREDHPLRRPNPSRLHRNNQPHLSHRQTSSTFLDQTRRKMRRSVHPQPQMVRTAPKLRPLYRRPRSSQSSVSSS